MAVHIHRSERTDVLLRGLGDLLRTPPADPFTPDVVAVPTRGFERFITQGLGLVLGVSADGADGVCANVRFPTPDALVTRVVAQATGTDPQDDPWLPQRAVWPLLAVIDESAAQPWCEALARHLGLPDDPARQDRRFAVASRLSALFATYAGQRPRMLLEWAAGIDGDGAGADVPPDLAWQPQLWRRLREVIGLPSLAERLDRACDAVRADPASTDLPDRLSVFGATRLAADHLQILTALGAARDVHLWLADASPALWSELPSGPAVRRRDDTSALHVMHPLLGSLGRDARELAQRLEAATDEYLPAALETTGVLGDLQRALRDNEDPRRLPPSPPDRSLQVHACHGPARQAEVLREVVLGMLEDDPTLQPRDILVMCPDLDTFAPLLSAAFCPSEDTGSLRLRIADRTPEQGNEVLSVLAVLLDLVTGRMELSAVLDFAAQPPVRTAFGFDDDDLERLEDLTAAANVRWGLDGVHRAQFQVAVPMGTWEWGLDRLLLGAAMSEQAPVLLAGTVPVDDVNSGDVDLVGRLAELLTRLQRFREAARSSHSLADWVRIVSDTLTSMTAVRGADTWQVPNALGAVSALADRAGGRAHSVTLSLADLRWMLGETLRGRPTRSNFRTGDLTVCGLAPMRSVPHRVICLVGMDDGAFPRLRVADGDDILARDPLVGERDPRSEDRQVLLDAVMAAGQRLVITYTGANERTNADVPPCVPLGDLLDTVAVMTGRTDVVRHPLQPFDARNFSAGALGSPGPFSHDRSALAAAERAARTRQVPPSLLLHDLPPVTVTDLSPQDLGTFLVSPPAAFLKARIGIPLRGEEEPPGEEIPLELGPLTAWQVGDRVLRRLLHGAPAEEVAAAERARGDVPPGALGSGRLQEIGHAATGIAQRFTALATGPARQVRIRLPGLAGSVGDVYEGGIVRATFSKGKPRDELRLWPELLALAAMEPGTRPSACLVTKDGGLRLTAPPPEEARRILADLQSLHEAGLRSPLPLPTTAAKSYAQRRAKGEDARAALRAVRFQIWPKEHSEREKPEVVALWGDDCDFDALLAERPATGEDWFDEDTRFGMLARRVWQPLLAARGSL